MQFVYKFDTIKKIKEIFEKRVQKEVASIQLEIDKARDEYDGVLKKRMQENKRHVKIISASDLKFHKHYLASLNEEMNRIRKIIDELITKKEVKMQELLQKSKEHKIFNTLEEIHLEEFKRDQDKIEMINIDEIAMSRYNGSRAKN